MKTLRLTSAFRKDLKRIARRDYDRDRLDTVVNLLRAGSVLPPGRRDHPLKGDWKTHRECHLEPDWLLIYRTTENEVVLVRTGTHADLFGS